MESNKDENRIKINEIADKFLDKFIPRVEQLMEEDPYHGQEFFAKKFYVDPKVLYKTINRKSKPQLGTLVSMVKYMTTTKGWALTYALGIDKNKKEENIDIGKTYGLSDEALINLKALNENGIKRKVNYNSELEWIKNPVNIVNWLLSNENLINLLSDIYDISAHYTESMQSIKEKKERTRQERFFEFEFQNKLLEFFKPIKTGIMQEAKLPKYEKLFIEENKED